jgi:hypothetical protein
MITETWCCPDDTKFPRSRNQQYSESVRASDADRQRVIESLQRHTAEGRLTLDEFSERVGSVFAARTLNELAAATDDLPAETNHSTNARQLVVAFAIALVALVAFGVLYSLVR